jgi:hypothetical protein
MIKCQIKCQIRCHASVMCTADFPTRAITVCGTGGQVTSKYVAPGSFCYYSVGGSQCRWVPKAELQGGVQLCSRDWDSRRGKGWVQVHFEGCSASQDCSV